MMDKTHVSIIISIPLGGINLVTGSLKGAKSAARYITYSDGIKV